MAFGRSPHGPSTAVGQATGTPAGSVGAPRPASEAEAELERSLSLLRATLEATTDGILVVDDTGKIVTYNQQFVEMWRIPEDVLAARDDERAIAYVLDQLTDPDGFQSKIKELYADPDAESFDVLLFRDGRIFERYSKPQRIGGISVGRVWSFRDVTERGRAEEALRAAEQKHRALVETIPAIVYVDAADALSSTLYISPQVESVLGYTAEEWKADPELCSKIIHPEDRAWVAAETERVTDAKGEWRAEYRMIAKDGRTVWIHDVATLVRDDSGHPAFWQGVLLDITEGRQAEEALRAAEKKYRALVEGIPAVVYLAEFGTSGPWRYVSPRIEEVLGYSPEEWMADPDLWYQRIHPEDRQIAAVTEAHTRTTGEPLGVEYRMIAKDGRVVWVRDEAVAVRDDDGRPLFLQGFMHDVTDRKQAEEELRRQKEELGVLHETATQAQEALRQAYERERETAERLRTVDEMKNAFMAAVSHELRTPLSSILGFAMTLDREEMTLGPEESREILRRLARNARKLDRLLSDLLDLDRLNRGIVEPRRRPTDVGALVRRAVDECDFLSGREVRVDADALLVSIDGPKVERIVENLLANAAKHTLPDTPVWVRAARADDGVLLIVEDAGPGVPEQLKSSIFEPFNHGTPVTHAPGTGIGLSLVARFAQLHGGRAWVEDRAGGGASFRVYLPAPSD
jgi:PAS domain S-box-containing protein